MPAVQGDGGVEVRQGVRAEREVQGGQVHTRGRVAVYGVLVSLMGGGGGGLFTPRGAENGGVCCFIREWREHALRRLRELFFRL